MIAGCGAAWKELSSSAPGLTPTLFLKQATGTKGIVSFASREPGREIQSAGVVQGSIVAAPSPVSSSWKAQFPEPQPGLFVYRRLLGFSGLLAGSENDNTATANELPVPLMPSSRHLSVMARDLAT